MFVFSFPQDFGQPAVRGTFQRAKDALHFGTGTKGAEPADRSYNSLCATYTVAGVYVRFEFWKLVTLFQDACFWCLVSLPLFVIDVVLMAILVHLLHKQ